MAEIIGDAGGSARNKAMLQVALLPAAIAITLSVFTPVVFWLVTKSARPTLTFVAAVTGIGIGLWISRKDWLDLLELFRESRDWARGAAGERVAADDLRLLPAEYVVFNDINPGFRGSNARWNWDHVVIGPGRIFVVDTKNYASSEVANSQYDPRTKRNVEQVRSYARAFKRELVRLNPQLANVFIVPVLAYAHPDAWIQSTREGDVRVLPMRLLRRDILSSPPSTLTGNEAVKIANLIFKMYEPHVCAHFNGSFRKWASAIRGGNEIEEPKPPSPSAPAEAKDVGPCPKCGEPMTMRAGQFGAFYGCSAFAKTGCKGKRGLDGRPK